MTRYAMETTPLFEMYRGEASASEAAADTSENNAA